MSTYRVLQIGHGGMGRLYAEALRQREALAGVVVRTRASAARLSGTLNEPVHTSLEEALDSVRPDAVAVLSPTELHLSHARAALGQRLPVLVIKPVGCSPAEALSLGEAARAAGTWVLAAHEGVFQPAFVALERAVGEGQIGAVKEIRWLKEGQDVLSGGRPMDPERPEDRNGTNFGFVYASVMHELYTANRLAGRKSPNSAEVATVHAARSSMKLDSTLRYEGGAMLRLRYHLAPGLPFRRGLQVVGDRGSVLWLMEPGRTVLQVSSGREVRDVPFRGVVGGNPALPVIDALLASLRGEGPPTETAEDGARALEAARLLTVRAAECAGHTVDVERLC